jgi:adenylate kinase
VEQVIAISGTPGTGKTAVGTLLAQHLQTEIIELGQVIKEQQFHYGEDVERGTLIADIESLQDYLSNRIQKTEKLLIVIGHFADLVPKELLKVLVVLRCHPVTLAHRLSDRQWSSKKIVENIQAEILGECTSQSLANQDYNQIFEIDTSDSTIEEVVALIKKILAGEGNQFTVGKISWLSTLSPQLIHEIMEEKKIPSSSQKA